MYALILLAGLCAVNALWVTIPRKLVCTYEKASAPNTFDIVGDVDPYLCTHLIYSSVKPDPVQVTASPSDLINFPQFNSRKNSNPNLKTLLEVDLTDLTSNDIFTPTNTDILIKSVIEIVKNKRFDGVNVVWAFRQSVNQPKDKKRFTLLMQELKDKLDEEGVRMLTASVSAVILVVDQSYDVPALTRIVDFFNVMTFDLDRIHSPISDPAPFINAQNAMQHWVSKGAPKGKLNMGIASYGFDTNTFLNNPSIRARSEVCTGKLPLTVHIDSDATIEAKAKYIIKAKLGGAFVKSVDLDDFHGNACGQGKYPVIKRIQKTFE
ncbi:acidic mammalian chitinase-like [Festucalex cinctus]